PFCLLAAPVLRNISFPMLPPFHHSACRRRQSITDQSSITPSSTATPPSPPPSAAFRSQRFAQNHPLPEPLPGQIPIDRQPLIASRGFVHRRLSDAGPLACRPLSPGRHPNP